MGNRQFNALVCRHLVRTLPDSRSALRTDDLVKFLVARITDDNHAYA
ncbi:hypothetical protein [Streptomyces qinzhouensis]|nr:hypothetical protein [Streptomyces qinzhouensis]